MRYLIDTSIFLTMANRPEELPADVQAILYDYENRICISAESLRELVVGYNAKKYDTRKWNTCEDVILSIAKEFGIQILPLDKNVMQTYSNLKINTKQDHRDPSDHVIISHAITLGIPLIANDTKFPFYRKQGLDLIYHPKTQH